MHCVAPTRLIRHAGCLIRSWLHSGGDDEHVVVECSAVGEHHGVLIWLHHIDLAINQWDVLAQVLATGLGHLVWFVRAEWHEEVTRLVAVVVVEVDDRHTPRIGRERLAQLVCGHGAGGATAENENLFHIPTLCPREHRTAGPKCVTFRDQGHVI